MTMKAELRASRRDESGKGAARRLRASGRVPAILYGSGMDSVSISVDAAEAEQLFRRISVENTLVSLAIAGEGEPLRTLVREVQAHPHKSEILHVDFYRIQAGVEVEVDIRFASSGSRRASRCPGGSWSSFSPSFP